MACKICIVLCRWLKCPQLDAQRFEDASKEWERNNTKDWDLYASDSDDVRAMNGRAAKIAKVDPSAALAVYKQAAAAGSAWSMMQVGHRYELGRGTSQDLVQAELCYRRAAEAGLPSAILLLAGLLFRTRTSDEWMDLLEAAARSDVILANYYLATYCYERNPSARTARKVRPLLEAASDAGYPRAKLLLSRWRATGKLGFGEMRAGYRDYLSIQEEFGPKTN